ncbi:MAG: Na+/H+ antiporter subunit E [Rhodospirillaceae bacterium]|nr:Na+/H+ antiporter subunit E [Rhodospirillaceae bacterium]
MTVRLVSLTSILFATWLLMSGHYDALTISFGVISCIACAYLTRRMKIVDHEGQPLHLNSAIVVYWLWLLWQIVKSNLDVALRCVLPGKRIDPIVFRAPTSQKTSVGIAAYANSITLTPGTVSMMTWDHEIEVHALTRSGADDVLAGNMDAWVTRVERRK